jgi:hypothetical protein
MLRIKVTKISMRLSPNIPYAYTKFAISCVNMWKSKSRVHIGVKLTKKLSRFPLFYIRRLDFLFSAQLLTFRQLARINSTFGEICTHTSHNTFCALRIQCSRCLLAHSPTQKKNANADCSALPGSAASSSVSVVCDCCARVCVFKAA